MNLNNVQSFANGTGGAVVAYRWMAFDSTGALVYADKDIDSFPVGTVLHDRAAADVDPLDITLHNCGGVHWGMAGGAIAAGAEVEVGDNGKIVTLSAGPARGRALNAATGDGSVIRVFVYGGVSKPVPADVATADATDLASSEALANALKVKLNALLAAIR
jgi:hypothetical protein